MNEPLFKSAHAALTFAYNFSESSLDRPLMNRMADKYKATGKGLAGLDGAAQAGMILRELRDLSRLDQMILIAKFGKRIGECPCCGGEVPNATWLAAVREISDAAASAALSGHVTMRVLRDGIVARYFGQKVHLQALAKKAGVHPDTATKQNGQVVLWLRGTRLTRKGREVLPGQVGAEQRALAAADEALHLSGILGVPIPLTNE